MFELHSLQLAKARLRPVTLAIIALAIAQQKRQQLLLGLPLKCFMF